MVIAISIGTCFDLHLNYSQAINFVKGFSGAEGIELLFATPKDLFDFEFEKEDLDFVNSLKFKSIHMPFHEIEYANNLNTKNIIEKGSLIASQISADYLVFHPSTIKDYSILDNSVKNCVENLNSKEHNKGFQSAQDMAILLNEYPELGLVIDTCHMLENNINPESFLDLKDKIMALHLAVQWQQEKRTRTHGFLQENPEQLEQIKPLLKLDVPKVIESDFYPEKVLMIGKEIDLIKSFENK